jgi:hypothetical protein
VIHSLSAAETTVLHPALAAFGERCKLCTYVLDIHDEEILVLTCGYRKVFRVV